MSTENLKILPQFLRFVDDQLLLIVLTDDQSYSGDYLLTLTCSLLDEFSNSTSFYVKIVKSNQENIYIPNYPPLFYSDPQNITLIAGSKLKLRLPDYFDPNPKDQVKITVQTLNKYPQFFQLLDGKFLEVNAGINELKTFQIIITLKDNNIRPLQSKYLIYATFIPTDEGQMNNTNIKITNNTKIEIRKDHGLDNQINVGKLSPQGIIIIQFEKPLNLNELLVVGSLRFDYTYIDDFVRKFFNLEEIQENPYNEKFMNFGFNGQFYSFFIIQTVVTLMPLWFTVYVIREENYKIIQNRWIKTINFVIQWLIFTGTSMAKLVYLILSLEK
ncbi:UNKNOWN [Stylonychia lemnae]|uniref:Uncharacterized protein n=1 Tax=Stylonychia lemnae TaxID=5949 RepID=A0A078AQE1_STYLE|nr:UNKNOWN [Stylonychia lemnae]|eukprot:CDW84640.1 UNKNOWN [Stylonychia lemnae]